MIRRLLFLVGFELLLLMLLKLLVDVFRAWVSWRAMSGLPADFDDQMRALERSDW